MRITRWWLCGAKLVELAMERISIALRAKFFVVSFGNDSPFDLRDRKHRLNELKQPICLLMGDTLFSSHGDGERVCGGVRRNNRCMHARSIPQSEPCNGERSASSGKIFGP